MPFVLCCELVYPRSGCGNSFEVAVVSKQFQGKPVLARHRLVHAALAGVMAGLALFTTLFRSQITFS
jgi:stress-induced morphogen